MTSASVGAAARRSGLVTSGTLLAGAVLVALGPAIGVVRGSDGSAPGVAGAAVWVLLLPALLAVAVSVWRPEPGLAAAAVVGLVAAGRLCADLAALLAPDVALRPELFLESSPRAHPFAWAGGAWCVLLGDVVMVVAGLAALRLLGPVLPDLESRLDHRADEPSQDGFGDQRDRPTRNAPMVAVGFLGVLGVLVGGLSVPYTGGVLDDRLLPPALSLWSVVGALVVAVLAGAAVLVAGTAPRPLAVAVLAGTGVAAAAPGLTAVVAVWSGASLRLGSGPLISLGGATVLALSALIARRTESSRSEDDFDAPALSGGLTAAPGFLALLAAAFALLAVRLPGLSVDGHRDTALDSGLDSGFPLSASIPAPFAFAGALLLVAGLLALIPPTARAGRVVVALAWAPLAAALTQALLVYSQVASNLADTADIPGITVHRWTLGPGFWVGLVGQLLAVAAAWLAVVVARRAGQASTVIAEDEPAAAARTRGLVVAAGLSVSAVAVGFLPAYRDADHPGPTLGFSYDVSSVGVWFLTLAMVGGAIAAGTGRRLAVVLAGGLGAAAVGAARLVIPAVVRAQPGFHLGPGYLGVVVLAVLFAAGAIVLGLLVRTLAATDLAAQVRRLEHVVPVGAPPVARASAPRPGTGAANRSSGGRRKRR